MFYVIVKVCRCCNLSEDMPNIQVIFVLCKFQQRTNSGLHFQVMLSLIPFGFKTKYFIHSDNN